MTGHEDADRRREPRVAPNGMRARVRPGYRLVVVDLSACGALLEAERPLRPGSQVDVHLETDARRETIPAHVVRCLVQAIDAQGGVRYRTALAFDETCHWMREVMTLDEYSVPCLSGRGSDPDGTGGHDLPGPWVEPSEPPGEGPK